MTFGQQNTEAEAHEQLSFAWDCGVNFLDTSEASVGRSLHGRVRRGLMQHL